VSVMAGLAVFALSLLFISLLFELSSQQEEFLTWIDLGICSVFIAELTVRFHRAPSKRKCIRESWADILGSIPSVVFEMSILRAFRLFRVTRITRISKTTRVVRVVKVTRVSKASKAVKAVKLARKLPKLKKTVKKFKK